MNVFLGIHLPPLTCTHLVVYVLFIFLCMNGPNYPLKLQNGFSLDIVIDHKRFLCYDPWAHRNGIPRNIVVVEHIPFYSFQRDANPSQVSNLPSFPTPSSSPIVIKIYIR